MFFISMVGPLPLAARQEERWRLHGGDGVVRLQDGRGVLHERPAGAAQVDAK